LQPACIEAGFRLANIPPQKPTATPRLKVTRAADWLRRNDPKRRLDKLKAKRERAKAAAQAKKNPALVAGYRKAMLKR
jgi:hypothetical protein